MEPKFYTGDHDDDDAFHAYWKGLTFEEKKSVRKKSDHERLDLRETAAKYGAVVNP